MVFLLTLRSFAMFFRVLHRPCNLVNTSGMFRCCPELGSSPRVRGTCFPLLYSQCGYRFIPARAGNIRLPAWYSPFISRSSPRVRGTFKPGGKGEGGYRFIPARAGNIQTWRQGGRRVSVHPRACGEHDRILCLRPLLKGSSPRVRGTFSTSIPVRYIHRFIPARAGNIKAAVGDALMPAGSSPRVRGTCPGIHCERHSNRFIPARAGNMFRHRSGDHLQSVHPRACGEHDDEQTKVSQSVGSSPRVRGTFP